MVAFIVLFKKTERKYTLIFVLKNFKINRFRIYKLYKKVQFKIKNPANSEVFGNAKESNYLSSEFDYSFLFIFFTIYAFGIYYVVVYAVFS